MSVRPTITPRRVVTAVRGSALTVVTERDYLHPRHHRRSQDSRYRLRQCKRLFWLFTALLTTSSRPLSYSHPVFLYANPVPPAFERVCRCKVIGDGDAEGVGAIRARWRSFLLEGHIWVSHTRYMFPETRHGGVPPRPEDVLHGARPLPLFCLIQWIVPVLSYSICAVSSPNT